MAKQIALEWDDREARLVVAQCRSGKVLVEHALTAPLPASESPHTAKAIGGVLAGLLSQTGSSKGEAIVVIGRASIELRRMKLPPAPPEELPDMARFQAVREFTNYADDWALDYEILSAAPGEATWVLAAVLSPQMLKFARAVTEAAGLSMGHLLLRPFAAASLFESSSLRGKGASPLLIDTAADESDLTALADDRVMFTRTVKIAHAEDHNATYGKALTQEIRRTLVAAQNQQAGYKVDQIILCDDTRSGTPLAEQIDAELGIAVRVLDPFEVIDASSLGEKPPGPGRFASLIGALLEESLEERHAIDFLDPKRRPPPPDESRKQLLMGVVAALLLVAVVGGIWWGLSSLDRRISKVNQTIRGNEELLKRYEAKEKQLAELEQFMEGDIIWLDELEKLSRAAPPPGQAIATQFRANLQANDTGKIAVEGVVVDSALIDDFESRLRDPAHRVSGKGGAFDQRGELPWEFNETITIDPTQIVSESLPEAAPTPKSTAENTPAKAGGA
jgi:Tfp pilus assembly PilM family ATPase